MREYIIFLAFVVFLTLPPQGSTQFVGSRTSLTRGNFSTLSQIVRFFGQSRVGYNLAVLPLEMMEPTKIEHISIMFITELKDGLLWMFRRDDGTKMHISLKDGNILFVYDGRSNVQQITLAAKTGAMNDFKWHTFKAIKNDTELKFYIDGKYIDRMDIGRDLQFVAPGIVDLGGTKDVAVATRNLVRKNFDGAITDVEINKKVTNRVTNLKKEMVVQFLQIVGGASQSGYLQVWNFTRFINGFYPWNPSSPSPPTTRRPIITVPPRVNEPVNFITGNAIFYLRQALDFRQGGNVDFQFRTLEPRGLLAIARGSSSSNNFFAVEIYDGKLYFVYNFNGMYGHKVFTPDSRVDNGEWHDVSISVDGNQVSATLDQRTRLAVRLSNDQQKILYFYRLYVGGYDDYPRIPWAIYSRQGYKGCVKSLRVNGTPVDLQSRFEDLVLQGVARGCPSQVPSCLSQPCRSGFCENRMGGYACNCASTPFTGENCDREAVIGSWDGTQTTIYRLLQPDDTHTNDISFRFLTPLANTTLFTTESRNKQDFVRAELVNGKVVVTFKAGGRTKTFPLTQIVNDNTWHTLHINRRADDVEVWVDDKIPLAGMIGGSNYILNIDNIRFGSMGPTGSLSSNNYIGYLQNFMYGDKEILGELKNQPNSNVIWITGVSWDNVPLITYRPVTVSTSKAHFQLPSLKPGLSMNLMFKFKTREPNGLMLYNAGPGDDVIAIELSNGELRLAYNLGLKNMFTMGPSRKLLNDNKWHTVQVSLNEQGQMTVRVDGDRAVVSNPEGDKKLDLFQKLYIGGLPEKMFSRPSIRNLIESRQGFRGCFASMDLNGAVPDLVNYATDDQQIFNGCSDLSMACKPDACGTGMCMPGIDSFWCDCNMTGYAGDLCRQYPIGYYFGKNGEDGVMVYRYPYPSNSALDRIAFGFMTKQDNAVLYRIEGNVGNEFIEIRLENGYVVAESNTGGGIVMLKELKQVVNDGNYHIVRYIRTGSNSTLQVDQLPTETTLHPGVASLFDKVSTVILGGRIDGQNVQTMNYNGIMAGAYYNGFRWMDAKREGLTINGQSVVIKGSDVVLTKPFILVDTKPPTPTPPLLFIPPDADVPGDIGGGGSTIGGTGTGGDPVIGIGGPGGDVTIFNGGTGINVPGTVGEAPVAAASLMGPAPPPMAVGARAGAVVGTVLGTMAFMSSLMWALYKLKPGVPTCLSPGAGSAGAGSGGGGGMSISSPRTTSNLGAVQAASAGGAGGAGGAGAGSGAMATKVTVVNGSAAGTFSNKGTAIGSPKGARANLGSSSSAYSANYQSNTMQSYSSDMGGGSGYDRQHFVSSSSGQDIPDYDMPVSGTLQSGHSYSSSTLNTHYNYQVQNAKTVVNRQGHYVLTSGGFSSGAVTPGAAADEVRVDCCLITNDGRYVVTGSSQTPPQVWDMQTGELQTIMKGDTIGSTNLHLLCGDRILVGAVHCDREINELSGRKGVFNHTLQMWDFQSGRPMGIGESQGEYCSVLCNMSDNDKILFGRTNLYGEATSIIAWNLMGNEMIKEMKYDAPVGNNDYINFLKLSKNDRYVVAGFTNSFENEMEFMVFDMSLTSSVISDPSMLKLNANPDCTVILPKDEAVTGLRNGDLVIWSIRTGQPSRQLLGSGGAHAHSREIKALAASEDGRYLVSASADGTLKVWDLNTERPIHTLAGHADEVWSCCISPDNEIIVSGSSDGTIRLWRMKNGTEMCVFNCGVDIFSVTMSRDKGTIVALGDKFGARKLIMLQVVRTKIKKIVSS